MKVAIDKEVAQALLRYLSHQPYGDVFQLVAALSQAQPVPAVEPKKESAKADKSAALKSAEAKLKRQLEEVTE